MLSEDQAHNHVHKQVATEAPKRAAFSLLRLSAAQRLAIVLVAVAALWGGVYWALS